MEDLGELSMWHAPSINDAYERVGVRKCPKSCTPHISMKIFQQKVMICKVVILLMIIKRLLDHLQKTIVYKSNTFLKGKSTIDTIGHDQVPHLTYIDDL